MKILYFYILRRILLALLLTLFTIVFVFVAVNLLRELFQLIATAHASVGVTIKAIFLLCPFVAFFALPISLLTACVIVFGRFTADGELLAARSSGVGLIELSFPILILSLVICILTAVFGFEISPRARISYKALLQEFLEKSPSAILVEDLFIKDIPGYILYINTIKGNELKGLKIYRLDSETYSDISSDSNTSGPSVIALISAPRATFKMDLEHRLFHIEFPEAEVLWVRNWQLARVTDAQLALPMPYKEQRQLRPKISEMRIRELQNALYEAAALGIDPTPITFQIHRISAFSFASFAFIMIGIPLAVITHRRETSIGVAIGLALMLIYYVFFVIAQAWRDEPRMYPQLIVWIPNFLYGAIGCYLFWRIDCKA